MSRPPESGSGEPVPAPTLMPWHGVVVNEAKRDEWAAELILDGRRVFAEQHHPDSELATQWKRTGDSIVIASYDLLDGETVEVLDCLVRRRGAVKIERLAASPGGEPPTPQAAQEALEALERLDSALRAISHRDQDRPCPVCAALMLSEEVRAALGSARPPLPPQEISPEMVEAAFGPAPEETAWLIELRRVDSGPPMYYYPVESVHRWTVTLDPNKATRFARREDAEAVRLAHEDVICAAKVTEHIWTDAGRVGLGEPSREPTLEESGWLIEVNEPGEDAVYWWDGGHQPWVTDSLKAVRFSRQEDAEQVIRSQYQNNLMVFARATEHLWLPRLSSPEAPREPKSTWPRETFVQETPPLRGTVEP